MSALETPMPMNTAAIYENDQNYNLLDMQRGQYQLMKIIQQTGGQTVNGGSPITSSGVESVFELPPRVYNLSKSILSYTTNLTVAAPATSQNLAFADCISEIRQIQLYTRGGLFLADIQFANNYSDAILRHETKFNEYIDNDVVNPLSSCVFQNQSYWEGLTQPFQALGTGLVSNTYTTYSYAPNIVASQNICLGNAIVVTTNSQSVISSPISPAQIIPATTISVAGPVINRKFRLNLYKNSIFAVDKDIYFGGETMYMRIIWDNPSKVYYSAIATAVNGSYNPASYAAGTSYSITNLTLFAAVEQNPLIENQLKNETASATGKKYLIPWVYTNRININANTSQTLIVRYNRAHGRKLLKVLWVPFNNTESGNTAYDHNNLQYTLAAGDEGAPAAFPGYQNINSFYTTVNNNRTSQFNYQCNTGDDYMVKSKKLKGSCILNSFDYYNYFVWREEFNNNYAEYEKVSASFPEDNIVDGLDLTEEQIYTIYATMNSTYPQAFNHYLFAVTLKELVVSAGGVQLL